MRGETGPSCEASGALQASLDLAGIPLRPQTVLVAARSLSAILGAVLVVALLLSLLFLDRTHAASALLLAASVPYLAGKALVTHPSRAAARKAGEVMKSSADAVTLMVMSLRRESSIPEAMLFASKRDSAFSRELRRCVWRVIMGHYSSFEEALIRLGDRWARFGGELKAALNAMVTASCEATEEGRRRALERANRAMVSGVRRRIEEYALSLSAPSMVLFGLGILLPLIAGSFLPMMAWDIWSADVLGTGTLSAGGDVIMQVVFVMNVLFPGIALLVAMEAVSRHPMESAIQSGTERLRARAPHLAGVVAATVAGVLGANLLLDGVAAVAGVLLASSLPGSLLLLALGRSAAEGPSPDQEASLEDILFKTGARMLEGENLECALNRSCSDLRGEGARTARRLSFKCNTAGQDLGEAIDEELGRSRESKALEALRVVRDAASKDEAAAGMLAMDVAAYLKELSDLETSLKSRLKPTISMMKLTARFLGPVVLGVTYSIYLSLAAVTGGAAGGLAPEAFFLVLGAFLAETNAITAYYVWGVEGGRDPRRLAWFLGSCLLVSEATYALTALMVS